MDQSADFTFLICSERSGSNLITKMLDSHPLICGPSPSHMIRTFSQNLLRYGDLSNNDNWEYLLTDIVALLNNQLGIWRSSWDVNKIDNHNAERSLASVIRYIYEEEARQNGKRHVFVKENKIYNFLPYLLTAFPESRYVYLVRDPRDMVLSWLRSPNHPGGVITGTDIWKNDQSKGMLIFGYLLQVKRIFLVRYEDLIEKPETQMKKLCSFMQLPYDAGMLRFHEQDLTVENANMIKDWENLGKPVLSANKQKYRSALSEPQIRYIEACCKNEMNFFGYPLDFQITDLEKLTHQIQQLEKDFISPLQVLNKREEEIRKNRLNVIKKIINRQFVSPFSLQS